MLQIIRKLIVLFPLHIKLLNKEANKMDVPNVSAVIRKLIVDNLNDDEKVIEVKEMSLEEEFKIPLE